MPPAGAAMRAAPSMAKVDVLVTPPVAIDQRLPRWRGAGAFGSNEFSGAIDFIIDEQGRVESVSLRKSVHPLYDQQLLDAAKTWTYTPARRGDQPIKFQKTLVVRLNARE
jgi:TonB family protein